MKLAALTLVLAAFVVAAPAWAQSPPRVPFAPVSRTPLNAGDVSVSDRAARADRPARRTRRRPVPAVALRVAAGQSASRRRRASSSCSCGTRRRRVDVHACGPQLRQRSRVATADAGTDRWTPVVLGRPDGAATVPRAQRRGHRLGQRTCRPRRLFVLADLGPARHGRASAAFELTHATIRSAAASLRLRRRAARAVPEPVLARRFPPGTHALAAAAVDVYGRLDPDAARRRAFHRPRRRRRPTATRTACPTRATTAPPTPTPTSPTATRTEWGTPARSCRPGTRRRRPA